MNLVDIGAEGSVSLSGKTPHLAGSIRDATCQYDFLQHSVVRQLAFSYKEHNLSLSGTMS
jgi:hypothetical protein